MIGCQRIPLSEVRDVFISRIYLRQYITHFLINTSSLCTLHVYISLITAFWIVYCMYWVFVCVCYAASDKLTSPPPFTGLGALHYGIRALGSKPTAWGHALGLPEG